MTPHTWALRVYYEDTDAGGVVYHASYLRFAERARTEMLREASLAHRHLQEVFGGKLVVTRCDARYLEPARLDDLLEVRSEIGRASGARLHLDQDVRRDGRTLCRLAVELAFIGLDLRPRRLPPALRGSRAGLDTIGRPSQNTLVGKV